MEMLLQKAIVKCDNNTRNQGKKKRARNPERAKSPT